MTGVLYVLHHPSFVAYQSEDTPEVYKLGLTTDVKQRLKGYTTAFLGKASFKYISQPFVNYREAEKVMFYLLQSARLSKDREFFGVSLQRVIALIDMLHSLHPDTFDRLYSMICKQMIPSCLRNADEKDVIAYITELPAVQFIHNIPYDEFLERYRFRPRKPYMYPNYVPPETQLMLKLIKENDTIDTIDTTEDNDE
jgi:hypothetical protein